MLHPNFKYFGELFSQWIPMNNFSEISTNISFLSRGIEEIASISLYVDSEIPSMAGIISLEPSTINLSHYTFQTQLLLKTINHFLMQFLQNIGVINTTLLQMMMQVSNTIV
jgi:hypothetical protein